jgi:glucokinase
MSDNIENLRGKGKISRVSVERLCAGPAVPLLYDFIATRNRDLERTLEKEGHRFEDLTSKMIIQKGIEDKDPLCVRVIEKFTEIFAVEAGNFALKTLS